MLEVRNLCIQFKTGDFFLSVVEKVTFYLKEGGTLGIVGESGCGKSVTAQALMGLLNSKQSLVTADTLAFNGIGLLDLQEAEWRRLRGNEISIIFQNPMSSLNPLMACGRQIWEVIRLHGKLDHRRAKAQALSLISDMGIPDPKRYYKAMPHELSGGMRQRIMIAAALACRPRLLIADEPTTALDVTIQAQILRLIRGLRQKMGMALILITHDLGIVKDMVDSLMVMYAGQAVEYGPAKKVLSKPRHPYTAGLIKSVPRLELAGQRLHTIKGQVPYPENYSAGCRFRERCHLAEESCALLKYTLKGNGGHLSACQFWERAPA